MIAAADWGTGFGCDFENIEILGTQTKCNVNNFGFLIIDAIYTIASSNEPVVYNFKNITNQVELQNEGTCTGVFVGSGPCFNSTTILNYENCVNNATILGSNVGFLYGNAAYIGSVSESNSVINVKDCRNNGVLMSLSNGAVNVAFAPGLEEINSKYQDICGGSYVVTNYLADKEISLVQEGSKFALNCDDDSVQYKMMLEIETIQLPDIQENTGEHFVSNGIKYGYDISIDNGITEKAKGFYAYDFNTAKSKGIVNDETEMIYESVDGRDIAIYVTDEVNYLIFRNDETLYKIDSNVHVKIYSYNSVGLLNGIKSL